jgi:diguanylate cyclase (GGDEF)-like protein
MRSERRRRRWATRVLAACGFTLVLGAMALTESQAQKEPIRELQQRFELRGSSAAGFLESSADSTLAREREFATRHLSGPTVSEADFEAFRESFGFGSAVLLDAKGVDLQIAPYRADQIGTNLAVGYDHLRSALHGIPTVSNVVPSAGQSLPIVAFATPFETPSGRRVVSGAFALTTQPMGEYLRHVLPYPGSVVYLLDAGDQVIAANNHAAGTLAEVDSAVSHALRRGTRGTFNGPRGSAYVTSVPVERTSWRLVMAVEESVLYQPITTSSRALPWIFLGAFGLAAGLLTVVLLRHREARERSDEVARVDALTGIPNRRATQEHLAPLLVDRRQHDAPFAVAIMDVDHFKAINDRLGHPVGDMVLQAIALRLSAGAPQGDLVGRWGGEEFLVLLSRVDLAGAELAVGRLCARIGDRPIEVRHGTVEVTTSAGVAVAVAGDTAESLVSRADAALYVAKQTGRNRVVVAPELALADVTG